MEVKIDLRLTVRENAAGYYEKSKKNKEKIEGAQAALEKTLGEIKKLGETKTLTQERVVKKQAARDKAHWYDKFRWFVSSDGHLVVGGKDATSNEILIKKHLERNDLVFHANVHGAPFFIVKNTAGEVPEKTMREAAEAAAAYSSAWKSGAGSCDVYMVKPDQISKTAESGEYLTKGAFVIRGERKWFRGVALRIAVGFVLGDKMEVIGGPVDAVSSRTPIFVVVGVGDMKPGVLSRGIKDVVLRKTNKDDGLALKKMGLIDVQKWIPGGGGSILK